MGQAPDKPLNGRYRLEEIIGEGGMAVVWRARDLLLDREVAVKVLRDQYAADPEFLERFHTEARLAAALNDPGVVAVYDVGEDGGRHYLVMEMVPGRDLKHLIREMAPLPCERAVAIASALAGSVAAAHRLGLVHRDIKPQNVLMSPDGRMKVTDFGIARSVTAARMTEPGLVMGTVHYVSPEQVAGEAATPASDVYSLGVVLYEMLTGQVPFEAESSVGVAMRILREEPAPVQTLNPRVPLALAAIVSRAMARRPEDRYPDAGALADDLARYMAAAAAVTGPLTSGALPAPAPEVGSPLAGQAKGAAVAAEARPRISWIGVLLTLVALLAVGGLIPLWLAVLTRVEAMPALPLVPDRLVSPTQALPMPTVDETAAVRELLVDVPAVEGLEAEEARRRLEAAGFGVTEPHEPSETVPAGRVVRQHPRPAELLPRGTVVEMVVSQGPEVRVPAVSGDYETVAAALLAAGFEPVRSDRWTGAGGLVGRVLGIDPQPGTVWPVGSPVHVQVDSGSWLPVGADFEGGLHLRGVDLPRAEVAPGDILSLVCTWEAASSLEVDYVMSASLTAADGSQVSRADAPPGDRPTSTYAAGERFSGGRLDLNIDPGLVAGDYSLWLAVRPVDDPESNLPVRSRGLARGMKGNRLLLALIQVG